MTDAGLAERWGRESALYETFRSVALDLLATDERFRAARSEWAEFFVTSHGDALADVERDRPDAASERPEDELFVDSLYYDFVVDRVVAAAEREFDFRLANREPRANTDALSFGFRALHDRVVEEIDALAGDARIADERERRSETVADPIADALTAADLRVADADFLRTLYESVVSRELRLALGEYHTPRGVAELAVDALDVDDYEGATFLDPGCGSGVFPSVCIERKIAAMDDRSPEEILANVTSTVVGIDLNPVAVTSTKLHYLLSLLPVLEAADGEDAPREIELPVFLTDALGLTREDDLSLDGEAFDPAADYLVGNPPWIPWSRLPERVKARWRELDDDPDAPDLLPHEGAASRLGFANDDVSLPFVWVCIDRYLNDGGGASFVLKRAVSKGPAGKLLRTLRVGDRPLALSRVHDFDRLRPFGEQVGANAAVYALRADADPEFPVETTAWTEPEGSERSPDFSSADAMARSLDREATALVPVDEGDATSAWVRADAERAALGECAHRIRHGVKDDAQAVFSIDRERLADLEDEFVYPYVKSRHVVKYGLFGHELRLVPLRKANEDNEAELRDQYPKTYDYLESHRESLESRSSSWLDKGPFYNVFGLGDYTWSEYKVAWCRLGFKPHFAVVSTVEDEDVGEKPVVPGDHFMFVGTDSEAEAHFLCALLNSAPYQRSLRHVASEGKASLSKSVVSNLALPEWRATATQRRLADLSKEAHEIVPEHTDTSKRAYNRQTIPELESIQAEIDRLVEETLARDEDGEHPDAAFFRAESS
ncbi:SAM-dependent methyltransferase [Halorussus gelatinilyticus]|uniref:SAM-dependent methyltransferase n=1 Tax=Halorussus gelatinilyticus TaxID=2937524 RepID=A0A8U0IMM6_9EURY|nr:SAM-dependent methyltransferase [Halorussus gelatinilyticus]UPW01444.1 SAM-dependent methyltransferase [Halorussus gelatinilyticus]